MTNTYNLLNLYHECFNVSIITNDMKNQNIPFIEFLLGITFKDRNICFIYALILTKYVTSQNICLFSFLFLMKKYNYTINYRLTILGLIAFSLFLRVCLFVYIYPFGHQNTTHVNHLALPPHLQQILCIIERKKRTY